MCVLVDPGIGRLELAEMKQDTPPCALVYIDRTSDTFDYNTEIVFTHDNPREFDWDELENVAMIVYTNAEDGYAKGAMLTRKNLLSNAESGKERDQLTKKHKISALLPFHHLFGLQTGVLTPLIAEASVLIADISALNQLTAFIQNIQKFQITNLFSLPSIFYILTKIPNIHISLSNVHKIGSGGCALPSFIYESFLQKTGKIIFQGYGITEASPVCSFYLNDDNSNFGSVGKPLSCNEIKIANGTNEIQALNKPGNIYIKGNNIFKGYYNNREATLRVFKNEWFYTGDIGKMDRNGYLYISGIQKKMLNINGSKAFPAELDRLLKKHENIKSIKLSIEPHSLHNTSLKATVELTRKGTDNETIFKKWCQYHLSNYKIPKRIEFV